MHLLKIKNASHAQIYKYKYFKRKIYSCNANIHVLLTPWCKALLEKLTRLQVVKKFPAFHGTRKFITALTSVRHLSLSWTSPIQSIYPHPTSWRSILILSTHLPLGIPSGLLPFSFPTKTLYTSPLLTYTRHMSSPSQYTRIAKENVYGIMLLPITPKLKFSKPPQVPNIHRRRYTP